jgi:hypothetical protein
MKMMMMQAAAAEAAALPSFSPSVRVLLLLVVTSTLLHPCSSELLPALPARTTVSCFGFTSHAAKLIR